MTATRLGKTGVGVRRCPAARDRPRGHSIRIFVVLATVVACWGGIVAAAQAALLQYEFSAPRMTCDRPELSICSHVGGITG